MLDICKDSKNYRNLIQLFTIRKQKYRGVDRYLMYKMIERRVDRYLMNKMIDRRIDRDIMNICKDRKKIAKIIET